MFGLASIFNRLGVAVVFLQTAVLLVGFFRHRRKPLSFYGWIGLAGLLLAEVLLLARIRPIAVYFTPIAWTCYILVVDAAVLAIAGKSRLHDKPRQFAIVALLSIPLWLVFEAYNLRLQNWTYVGVPREWPLALLGYGWSFATITPGIFETADLVESFGWFRPGTSIKFSRVAHGLTVSLGAIFLIAPLIVPQTIARYLFILVWVGFVLLLDPINYRSGLPSLLGDFEKGLRSRFYSLLAAGFVCGWFWEFWNYWAAAKWYYIFPMFQQFKIFEMPIPGYLGFLPFALECFVMYVAAVHILRGLSTQARNTNQATVTE
jgi:hypothetical protein